MAITNSAGISHRHVANPAIRPEPPAPAAVQPERPQERARPQPFAADVFETQSTQQAQSPQSTHPLNVRADPNGANKPAIQSHPNTVQAGTVTLDEQTKRARGAVKIERGPDGKADDPTKYDGFYVGADGYAYPPQKFSISEVPPFKPEKPVATPTPTTYYVNGIDTQPLDNDHASGEAQKLANKTGTNVVLIYNATEGVVKDAAQTAGDRVGAPGNKATDTLTHAIYNDLQAGKQVNVAGYSQGGAVVAHALRQADDRIAKDNGGFFGNLPVIGDDNRRKREALLGNVNVTSIAGAGKTFPDGPRYNFYVNNQDPVPTGLGSHGFNPVTDIASAAAAVWSPIIGVLNGGPSLQVPRGGRIHPFDASGTDPRLFSVDGRHGFNTYLSNIQDSVP